MVTAFSFAYDHGGINPTNGGINVGTNRKQPVGDLKPGIVAFHTIAQGGQGGGFTGFSQPTYLVINDQAEFATFWTQTFCSCSSVPAVDFAQRTVLAAFLGLEYHGGYVISIAEVNWTGSSVTVTVLIRVPGPLCLTTQNLNGPFHIVDIPKTEEQVSFTSQTQVTKC